MPGRQFFNYCKAQVLLGSEEQKSNKTGEKEGISGQIL